MKLQVVLITGMSGAGRSTALRAYEDLGFFCVDNLPPPLITALVSLLGTSGELSRIAVGVDVRTGTFLAGAATVLDDLVSSGHETEVVFLDCSDDGLVRRFSETRRGHPLAPGGDLLAAIQSERERVAPLRARAKLVIDTTRLTVHELRRTLVEHVARGHLGRQMVTRVVSFGFRYGLPVDADLVFDLRHLPNPHFVPELRPQTGLDQPVSDFVLAQPEALELLADIRAMLVKLLPRYEREGKAYLTVALGCTGGRHRSVALTEALAERLRSEHSVTVAHRDVTK